MEQIQMVSVDALRPHGHNPRIDAAQVEALVESIREHGVEVPLVAAPTLDPTTFVVLGGHRRLTAALQLGLAEVPVQIRPDLVGAADQLAFMATENLHRDQLTAAEEARLVGDMLDLGLSQAEIAKQTALGKKRVSERVKLSRLGEQTGEKIHRGQISVDEALIISEYQDDQEIAEQLENAAGIRWQFDQLASRARARREAAQAADAARKTAKKKGLRLVDTDDDFVPLEELVEEGWSTPALDAAAAEEIDGEKWKDLLAAEHEDCPGHSAHITPSGFHAGELRIGCDQVANQHASIHPDTDQADEPEAEPDPWDDLTAEDFATARIHREQHLAKVLPDLDIEGEVKTATIKAILDFVWPGYGEPSPSNLSLIQGLTEVKGKDKAARILDSWDLPALIWLHRNWWDLTRAHHAMSIGRQGSSYWGTGSRLRKTLDATGYEWTDTEQQAILLATGIPHDHDPDADAAEAGAALAEGGEAA